jgi:hypothetical protein
MTPLGIRLVALSMLTWAAAVHGECSWRVGWPNDDRIRTAPWGTVPPGIFVTRIECERAIEKMLREAMRDQALLIDLPACICIRGYDDLVRSLL